LAPAAVQYTVDLYAMVWHERTKAGQVVLLVSKVCWRHLFACHPLSHGHMRALEERATRYFFDLSFFYTICKQQKNEPSSLIYF
jgi:hypothetical protein